MFFFGEKLFNLTSPENCEDIGILELRHFGEKNDFSFLHFFVYLACAFSLSSIEQLMQHVYKGDVKVEKLDIQNILVTGWTTFTTYSLLTLVLFGRAQISYVMKFIHVWFELAHLSIFMSSWGWSSHCLITMTLSLFAFFATLSMPCEVAFDLTTVGAVLDTWNFVVCWIVATRTTSSRAFRIRTLAFAAHATYIWSFLIMGLLKGDQVLIARVYGVFANALSVALGVLSVLIKVLPEYYDINYSSNFLRVAVKNKVAEFVQMRNAQVSFFKPAIQKEENFVFPSTSTYFALDVRSTIRMYVLCFQNSMYEVRKNRLYWMEMRLPMKLKETRTILSSYQHPTYFLFWVFRTVNWAIFLNTIAFLLQRTTFLSSFVLAWMSTSVCVFLLLFMLGND